MLKKITLLFILLETLVLQAYSINLSADSQSVSMDDNFRVYLKVVEKRGDSVDKIIKPDFSNFVVVSSGESTSSTFNMINGSMNYTKTKTFTFVLQPQKEGTFQIGPAKLVLDSKQQVNSNTLSIIVTSSVNPPQNGGQGQGNINNNQQNMTSKQSASTQLQAPLTIWEQRSKNYFIRTVVSPIGDKYKGEPIAISYYLFTKRNAISDVAFQAMPIFNNVFKKEIVSPQKLTFRTIAINGEVFDYALLKTYLVIPPSNIDNISVSQMIMIVTIGDGFFDASKRRISSVALNIPLKNFPKENSLSNTIYGNFSISQSKEELTLSSSNIIDTLVFKLKGCGNFETADIKLKNTAGIKIFSPETKIVAAMQDGKYCGEKEFKFMIKGLKTGVFTIPQTKLNFYNPDIGYKTVSTKPIKIKVTKVSVTKKEKQETKQIFFEFLKELPKNTKIISIKPITTQLFFLILVAFPILSIMIALLIKFFALILKKHSQGRAYQIMEWKKKIEKSNDLNELTNNFYNAFFECHSLNLKGERSKELEKKFGNKIKDAMEFIQELHNLSYSNTTALDLKQTIKKAVKIFEKTGRLK